MVAGFFNIGKKGQLSVEFLLILLVVLIIIETIIIPLRDYSQASVEDMVAISYLEENISKIQSVIQDLNTYSEAKLTLKIHVPEDANFYITNVSFTGPLVSTTISYSYVLKSYDLNVGSCSSNGCLNSTNTSPIYITHSQQISTSQIVCTVTGNFKSCIFLPITRSGYLLSEGSYLLEFKKSGNTTTISKEELYE